jgi:hypothetical protein
VTSAELEEAHQPNALFDAHRDDPEFGFRFLVDEAADAGGPMAPRVAWLLSTVNSWFSVLGNKPKRGHGKKADPPVHEALVKRDFTASGPTSCGWAPSPNITRFRARFACAQSRTYLRADHRILDRRKDEIPHRSKGPEQRCRPPWRCCLVRPAYRSRMAVSKQKTCWVADSSLLGRILGPCWCRKRQRRGEKYFTL